MKEKVKKQYGEKRVKELNKEIEELTRFKFKFANKIVQERDLPTIDQCF